MTSRTRLLLLVASGLWPASVYTQPARANHTYVFVHGAWGGGWDWRGVDSLLTAQGHRVYRVTLTGLGERVHLASPSIGLTTHIMDVMNTISWEQLKGVVLVGHSYGGMVITGVADRIPERLRALIYVDAFVPESGESVERLNGAQFAPFIAQNTKDGMIHAPWASPESAIPKDVPQPLKTFTDTLLLSNPAALRLTASYILDGRQGSHSGRFLAVRRAGQGPRLAGAPHGSGPYPRALGTARASAAAVAPTVSAA